MCIKIICSDHEHEFNPSEPLEQQMNGAQEVVVNYDPLDSKIDSFVTQFERIVKDGVSCKIDIKVNVNDSLNGMKLERHLEKLKLALDINEAIKGLALLHANTDRKLCEISKMCLGKINEQ